MSQSAPLEYNANQPASAGARAGRSPRVWVGIAIVLAMWGIVKVPEWLAPMTKFHFLSMFIGPVVGMIAFIIWWLAASRFPWPTRRTGFAAFLGGLVFAFVFAHHSLRPMGLLVLALPVAVTAWGLATVIGSLLGPRALRSLVPATVLLTWIAFTLVRNNGLTGSIHFNLESRFGKTAEQRYLASIAGHPKATPATTAPVVLTAGDWPGFRGPNRDGKLAGVSIRTDWATRPPRQLWHHLIGPGWGSFCVVGDRLFTQEQRGESEVVVCFSATTGDELWSHADPGRFDEQMGGPGPRATPTFDHGRLYTTGALGILNCLDPVDGHVIWSRDLTRDTQARVPMWGFSGSPLVSGGLVYVITGGPGKSVAAYNASTGEPAWAHGDGWSYASPQLATIDGVEQLLFVSDRGLSGLDPGTGSTLWDYEFKLPSSSNRTVQPTVLGEHDFLLATGYNVGTRRIHVARDGGTWKAQAGWTSRGLNAYYNDMVVYQGHVYAFDNSTFECLDFETGARSWRVHEYGAGQVLLLADQGLLVILSETGEAALVAAKPEAWHELARFQALEGKTWNHPVIAHGKLFVRNGEEIACYELN